MANSDWCDNAAKRKIRNEILPLIDSLPEKQRNHKVMKANEAPEKIYIPRLTSDGKLIHEWNNVPFKKFRLFFDKEIAENIEYTRTDAFIEKAAKWIRDNANNFLCKDINGKPYLYRYGLAAEFIKAMMKE